ncbi:MAG: ATP synthase F1 subunit epsilon [Verrucomicrobiota bacterium]
MFQLEIVTPEREAYSDEVDSVTIPAVQGEMGVLSSHAPLVTVINPGEVIVKKGNEEHALAVGEGFVEVLGNQVSVMTDMALEEDSIDESAVEEALKRAEQALEEGGDGESAEQLAALQATIQKSLAQLKVKRRRRSI